MRKVRHPYQVLNASEMVVGQQYAFIFASEFSGIDARHYTMGGVINDSHAAAIRLGHNLDLIKELRIDMLVEMLVANAPSGSVVTVHMDGWHVDHGSTLVPALMYWMRGVNGRTTGWDRLSAYFGPEEEGHEYDHDHCIAVPRQRWEDDPRLHVSNWDNPNGVVERVSDVENADDWERKMRARKHAAMAKMLGF